jgi:RNA polymerase primary sigma factor
MARFRIDSVAGLARQMTFAPREARLAQVIAAEGLIHDIDPARAYPLDFVIYRITGYRPKKVGSDLLTGLALQHDLGLLVEQVSATLDLRAEAMPEPVLLIEEVAERFGVTSKTIQRWRRRGLAARRFVFGDGRRRVGFLLGSVERFVARQSGDGEDERHEGTEARRHEGGEDEVEWVVRQGRRLVGCGCCEEELTRRIGRRMGRSPFAVLHLLRKFDQEHPGEGVLGCAGQPLSGQERAMILRGVRKGIRLGRIARRVGRRRAAVHQVMLQHRIERLSRRRVRFIDDPLYHQPDVAEVIEEIVAGEALADASERSERIPPDVPAYLRELYHVPLLSAARERALFLEFNFHKYQFVMARRRIDPELAGGRDLAVLERYLQRATAVRNRIVEANLRLVVSVARRHMRPGLELMELVSEGNVILMRAVESFDLHRGNRFSTYATLALMKGFARAVPQMLTGRQAGALGPEAWAEVADHRMSGGVDRLVEREELAGLLSRLGEREREVLRACHGVERRNDNSAALRAAAKRMGISLQRVHQIEQSALRKLRGMT